MVENAVRRGNRNLVIALTTVVPESTASDRVVHQQEFKQKLRMRYNCIHSSNPDVTKCMVLNHFFTTKDVTAGHLVSLNDRRITTLIGFSTVWDERNGILVYKPLDLRYRSMELTYVPNPTNHSIVLRVLYDSIADTALVPHVRRSTVGIAGSGNVTYGDINGRELQLPVLTYPYRRAFLRHAHSSYNLMNDGCRPHRIGTTFNPTEEEWDALFEYCKVTSPECSDSDFIAVRNMSTDVDV